MSIRAGSWPKSEPLAWYGSTSGILISERLSDQRQVRGLFLANARFGAFQEALDIRTMSIH